MILFAYICPNGCRHVPARLEEPPVAGSPIRIIACGCGAEFVLHRIELSDLAVQADAGNGRRLGGPVETGPRSAPAAAPPVASAQGADRGGDSSTTSPGSPGEAGPRDHLLGLLPSPGCVRTPAPPCVPRGHGGNSSAPLIHRCGACQAEAPRTEPLIHAEDCLTGRRVEAACVPKRETEFAAYCREKPEVGE